MSSAEFAAWKTVSRDDYAADKCRALGISLTEAMKLADASLATLLPDGMATPDTYLYTAEDDAGSAVGWLWISIRREWGRVECFIYDVGVFEDRRRKGHGLEILKALEPVAVALGATSIGLHVFGDNPAAIALYEKSGFRVTDLTMSKRIPN